MRPPAGPLSDTSMIEAFHLPDFHAEEPGRIVGVIRGSSSGSSGTLPEETKESASERRTKEALLEEVKQLQAENVRLQQLEQRRSQGGRLNNSMGDRDLDPNIFDLGGLEGGLNASQSFDSSANQEIQ